MMGLLLLVMSNLMAQDPPKIKWYTFEEATKLNQKEPKMVLVDVYTDWCGWCKKMDKETFTDAKVIQYINENFYAVKLNAEDNKKKFKFRGKEYTEASMAKVMQVNSYPNFVIIDAALENITQLPGYRQPEAFLKDLTTALAQLTGK